MAQWYYQIDGETHGPISERKFKRRVASGMLRPSDLVCRDGMKDWVTIASLDLMSDKEVVVPPASRSKRKSASSQDGPAKPVTPPPRPQLIAVPPPVPLHQTTFERPARKSDRKVLIASFIALSLLFLAVVAWAIISNRPASNLEANANTKTQAETKQTVPLTEAVETNTNDVIAQEDATDADNIDSLSDARGNTGGDKSMAPAEETDDNMSKNGLTDEAGTSEPSAPPFVEPLGAVTDTPQPEKGTGQVVASQQPSESQATEPKTADKDEKRIGLQDMGVVVLYQELDVARNPKFIVQGLPFDQELRYQVLSEFRIGKLQENGSRTVEQTVIDAKLVSADALSRAAMGEAVTKLKGRTFAFKLNQLQEVEDFAAGKEGQKSIKIKAPFDVLNTEGFRITSVIDQDGWKELAQLSFFVPRDQQQAWVGQMRHDWDALGSWEGETTYRLGREQKNLLPVKYAHKMKYTAPKEGGAGGLPFEIGDANFKPNTAGGLIQYDLRAGRVTAVQENFHVLGELDADVLGQKTKIQVEEQQVFTLRLLDQNPWQQ